MKHKGWKKVAAFVLALALVVGNLPANVGGGGLFGGTAIVASAEEQCETLDTNNSQYTYSGTNVTVTPESPGDDDGFMLSKWVYENPEDSTEDSATITVAEDYKITKLELVRGFYDGTPVISSDTAEMTQNGETFIFTNVNASSVTVSCSQDNCCQIKQVKVYYDYSKTDISDATVTLKADNTVASVTVGGDKITDLSKFDITYGTDDSHTAATPPTIIGSYFAYVTAKDTNKDYRGTAKSAEFKITKSTVKTAEEFKAAVNKGEEVQLDADIILPLSDSLTFEKNMTLDLNGHTLTVEKAGRYDYLSVDASLTIKDSAGNGKLIHSGSSYVFLVYVEGALYLESGTLEFTNSGTRGIDVFSGPFIMKGGTINSAGYSIWRDGTPLTISGGTINGGFYGSDGDLTITGGKFSFDPTEHLDTTRFTAEKDGEYWNVLEYISDATVNLADDFTVISLTIGDKTITDLSGFDVIYAKTDSDITSETVPTKKGTYVAYVTAKDTNKEYKGTAKSAVFTQKNDISGAAVALNADNTVASITIGDETITDLTDFDITYGTDNSHTATTPSTIIGSYFAYVTAKDTNNDYKGTAKSAAFKITKSTVKTAEDFRAAVNKGGEVQLGADIILPLSDRLYFEKNMTLDLNGHTLTVEKVGTYDYLSVGASLTIKDSVGNGKLIHPDTSYVFIVYVGGALYLESGTLEFTNSGTKGIDVFRGPFIMKGGTINSAGYSIWRDGTPLTISGGTINGRFYESDGDLTITGGNFNFDPSDYIDKNNYHVKKVGDRWLVVANVLDISEATVNLADDHTVASITVDNETITDLSGFDVTYGTDDSHTATSVPTAAGTYYAFVSAKNTNKDYKGTAKSAKFTQKNDISEATVNLTDDYAITSITVGNETIIDLSDFDIIYAKTDSDITSETVPTEPGTYVAYVTAKDTNDYYNGTAKSAEFTITHCRVYGHSYGEPVWTWNDDNTASIKVTCSECDDEQTVSATVTSETIAPTYNADGKIVYTAKAIFNNEEYTSKKEVKNADKLPLTHVEAKAETCENPGNTEYWLDEANNKYFSAANGEHEIAQADTVIAAKGHDWNTEEDAIIWNWDDLENVTATFNCKNDASHTLVKDAVINKNETPATYESDGKIVYTATVTVDGKEYSDEKVVVLPMLEKIDISKATITFANGDTFTADGSDQSVAYSVSAFGTVLTEGIDYEMYEGDATASAPGTYIVKIKAKGEGITGEKTFAWYIIPAPISVKVNGEAVSGVEYGKSITVTAPAAPAGQKFSHWAVGTEPVCYSEKYSFIAKESVDLTPVYVEDAVVVEAQPVLTLNEVKTVYNGKNAIGFEFTHTTPGSYTIEEVGLLYATNKLAGYTSGATVDLTQTDFDIEDAVKNNRSHMIKKFVADYTNHNGTISFSYAIGNNTDCYVYAAGYIKGKNANGEEVVLYTDFDAVTYNTIG